MSYNRARDGLSARAAPWRFQMSQTGLPREGRENDSERAHLVGGLSIEPSDLEEVDPGLLVRKLHKYVLPLCLLILFLGNIDRGNLGFAANQLCRDLDLTHTQYGTGASAFFVGYLLSRIPSNLALRYFGAPLWLMVLMFSWGVAAAGLAFIHGVTEFYLLRLLLGIAEGGAFPGVWYYLTGFFPDEYLSFPYTIIAAAAPIATAVSGPIAAIFFSLDGKMFVRAWRALFFFEGLVPAVLAPVMFFFIPKSINRAHFLTADERLWLQQRMKIEHADSEPRFFEELKVIFRSMPFWIINIFGIVHLALFAVITYWTTLMIEETYTVADNEDDETCASSKSTSMASIIMTAFVFILSSISTLALGVFTKKGSNRSWISGWITALCGLALASWALTDYLDDDMGLISLTIAACAMNAPTGLIVGLMVSHFDSNTKSTALSVYSTIVTLGALIGPIMTGAIVDYYGNYNVASVVLGAFGIAGGILLSTVKDPLYHTYVQLGQV